MAEQLSVLGIGGIFSCISCAFYTGIIVKGMDGEPGVIGKNGKWGGISHCKCFEIGIFGEG